MARATSSNRFLTGAALKGLMMDDLTHLPLTDFLDELAARKPTPGGGAVAAAAGALACAMARMVAAYSVGPKTESADRQRAIEAAARLERTDELMRQLVTADGCAYEQMTAAAKAARNDDSTRPAHQQAVVRAIGAPLEMAAVAQAALDTMDQFKDVASRYLLSDLGVAAVLAAAAAHAARYNVLVNLAELDDEKTKGALLADIDAIVGRCDRSSAAVRRFVDERL